MSDDQTRQATDDLSGPGWAWVPKGDKVREGDMWRNGALVWCTSTCVGQTVKFHNQYRRRIEPQPSPDNLPNEVQVLVDLLRGVQDWSGTRVGDAIDVIEAQLFRREGEAK